MSIQSIQYRQHFPPKMESFLSVKRILFSVVNFATFGIHEAANAVSHRYHITKLSLIQKDLEERVTELVDEWDRKLEEFLSHQQDEHACQQWSEDLENGVARDLSVRSYKDFKPTLMDMIRGTITFVGQWVANILTLGIYGVYQNYVLKNRIVNLEIKIESLQTQSHEYGAEKLKIFRRIHEIWKKVFLLEKLFNGIRHTPAATSYLALEDARNQLRQLNAEFLKLKTLKERAERAKQIADNAIQTQKKFIKGLEDKLEGEKTRIEGLNQEVDRLQKRDRVQVKQLADIGKQIADLQSRLEAANAKARRVPDLEAEVAGFKAKAKQPDTGKFGVQLDPIPSKYTPLPTDGLTIGAMDLDLRINHAKDVEAAKAKLSAEDITFGEDYNRRYGDKHSAAAVIEASFHFMFDSLMKVARTGKVRFNESRATWEEGVECIQDAVYRAMVLDLIAGAKVVETTYECDGFMLSINSQVVMLPSQPERICRLKKGCSEPVVELDYRLCDDFVSKEHLIKRGVVTGVQPVAVKWILNQLSSKEKVYLTHYLISALIENCHSDYIAMQAFMSNTRDPRVQLVMTAAGFIQDIAYGVRKKFGQNVLLAAWQAKATSEEQEPFIKPEEDLRGLERIRDIEQIQATKAEKFVDWELDLDVLGDKREMRGKLIARQPEFADLISQACVRYGDVFAALDRDLLRYPEEAGKQFATLGWDSVNRVYYVGHEMIGADVNGFGGERCLFSNLLALFCLKTTDLKPDVRNVRKLKRAMAAYLDKLQSANNTWLIEKRKVPEKQSPDAPKLKEMATLFTSFETAIRVTHKCTLASYQIWLRGETSFNVPSIDPNNLTTLEGQLAAYTLGVRIGFLPINIKVSAKKSSKETMTVKSFPTKVDSVGRIIPEAEIYGPNTKALFLIGVWDDGKGGSYYSLFPKLNTASSKLKEDPELNETVLDIEAYWKEVERRKQLRVRR